MSYFPKSDRRRRSRDITRERQVSWRIIEGESVSLSSWSCSQEIWYRVVLIHFWNSVPSSQLDRARYLRELFSISSCNWSSLSLHSVQEVTLDKLTSSSGHVSEHILVPYDKVASPVFNNLPEWFVFAFPISPPWLSPTSIREARSVSVSFVLSLILGTSL